MIEISIDLCFVYYATTLCVSNEKQSTWLVRNGCSVGVKNAYAPRASTSDKTVEESVMHEIEQEYSLLPGLYLRSPS